MKIVLIGGGGFLGNKLLNSFLTKSKNFDLAVLSSSLKSNSDFFSIHYYRWPENSLSDSTYRNILGETDIIIYAAGAGVQPGVETDERSIYAMNLYEPARLVNSLTSSGFNGQLISFGSYFESGINQPDHPLDEINFLRQYNPLPNPYCRVKKQFTLFHDIFENVTKQFSWLHLVLTNIYGPGENKNRLIRYIISQSRLNKELHFTNGNQVRQYTFADDIIRVVHGLLGRTSGMYHVTNRKTVAVKDIILETLKQVEQNFEIKPEIHFDLAERRDTEMNYLAISPEKLYKEWDLSCDTGYQQGINSYFDK